MYTKRSMHTPRLTLHDLHEELEAHVEDEHVALVEASALARLFRGPHRALPLALQQARPVHVALDLWAVPWGGDDEKEEVMLRKDRTRRWIGGSRALMW